MNRAVITGIGALTPLGNSFADSWYKLKSGASGIAEISGFDTSNLYWKSAGELKRFDILRYLNSKEIHRFDPFIQYAVAAATMALEDASLLNAEHKEKQISKSYMDSGGVIIGSSRGGISTIEKAVAKRSRNYNFRSTAHSMSPYLMPSTTISMAASYVAQRFGIQGYCLGISTACTSGTNAIGEAFRLIQSGYIGPILAGGAEAPICRLCVEGYGSAGALSKIIGPAASRPFEKDRSGFVLSEGASVLVIENRDHALRRGAKIYAEIIAYGNTVDAFHQTRPHKKGEMNAMRTAITGANAGLADIDYISAHAPSTQIGDLTESQAIADLFGERTPTIPVTSIKSMTGHMLAASGAFETACLAMSLKEGVILPTINLIEKDRNINLNVVTTKTIATVDTGLINSFGFGGVNAVLVLKKSD